MSYYLFRLIERRVSQGFSKAQIAFFYAYAALVYACAALLVSWMWLYYINLFVGVPCLILVVVFRKRAVRLGPHTAVLKVSLGMGFIAIISCILSGF